MSQTATLPDWLRQESSRNRTDKTTQRGHTVLQGMGDQPSKHDTSEGRNRRVSEREKGAQFNLTRNTCLTGPWLGHHFASWTDDLIGREQGLRVATQATIGVGELSPGHALCLRPGICYAPMRSMFLYLSDISGSDGVQRLYSCLVQGLGKLRDQDFCCGLSCNRGESAWSFCGSEVRQLVSGPGQTCVSGARRRLSQEPALTLTFAASPGSHAVCEVSACEMRGRRSPVSEACDFLCVVGVVIT